MSTIATRKFSPERVEAIHRLRVNVKSLAAEGRFIRHEIRRAAASGRTEAVGSMQCHRDARLRPESRAANLALAFLYGTPYKKVEAKTKIPVGPELSEQVVRKVRRFWYAARACDVQAWLDANS